MIRSIRKGSTHLNAQLATPEDQDLATVLSSVKEKLSKTNQLGGVSVISVAKIKILGTPDDEPIKNNDNQNNSSLYNS